jgi:hypothetical protein
MRTRCRVHLLECRCPGQSDSNERSSPCPLRLWNGFCSFVCGTQALAAVGYLDFSSWATEGIKLGRYKWTRTARTDARVHALCQVVSLRMQYPEDHFADCPLLAEAAKRKNSRSMEGQSSVVRTVREEPLSSSESSLSPQQAKRTHIARTIPTPPSAHDEGVVTASPSILNPEPCHCLPLTHHALRAWRSASTSSCLMTSAA